MHVYNVIHSKSYRHRAVGDVMETVVMQCRVTREKERKSKVLIGHVCTGVWFARLLKLHLYELVEETVYCPFGRLLHRLSVTKGGHHEKIRILDLVFNIGVAVRKEQGAIQRAWPVREQPLWDTLWKNRSPEKEWCGFTEVERIHGQASHGYRHGVVSWTRQKQMLYPFYPCHRNDTCIL